MTINTKYNIGDEVWFYSPLKSDNKCICQDKIEEIVVDNIGIAYNLGKWSNMPEDILDPTKEELLNR